MNTQQINDLIAYALNCGVKIGLVDCACQLYREGYLEKELFRTSVMGIVSCEIIPHIQEGCTRAYDIPQERINYITSLPLKLKPMRDGFDLTSANSMEDAMLMLDWACLIKIQEKVREFRDEDETDDEEEKPTRTVH